MEDFSDSVTCVDETQDGYYVSIDTAASELPVGGSEPSFNMNTAELYGDPIQYEQYQTTTTAIQFDQTLPAPETSYDVYATAGGQQPQLLETQTAVSVTEYATYSTGQTYDASQTMVYAIPVTTTGQDNVTSGLVQSYQVTDTAYTTPAAVDGSASQSFQVMTDQPAYVAQPAQTYQVDASTMAPQPGQTSFLAQPQIQTQSTFQPVAYQQVLQVAPDGQHYYIQVPVPAQQPGIHQLNPNTMQAQPLTLQLQFTKPKILRRETASQAKEATIKFSKQAYAKSKEFITNKDGARAVAKQTWKQSKNLTIKTTDMLDKYVRPLMPFIATQDMELAMALRVGLGVGNSLKGPGGSVQRRPVGGGGQGVQQMDAAALANLTQVLALLQSSDGIAGGTGDGVWGQTDEGQARLLAALLQLQLQQRQAPHLNVQSQVQGQRQPQHQSFQPQTNANPLTQPAQKTMLPQIQPQLQQQQQQGEIHPQVQQVQQQTTTIQMQQQAQPKQVQQYQVWNQEVYNVQPPASGQQTGQEHPLPAQDQLHAAGYQQRTAKAPMQHPFPVPPQQPMHSNIRQPLQQQQQYISQVSMSRPQRKPVGSGPVSASQTILGSQSPLAQAQPTSSPPVVDQHVQSKPGNDLESSLAKLSLDTQPQVVATQPLTQQP